MNFGSPGFLWALPAALLPLILHFLNRRRPTVVQFSHLSLLRLAHRTRMPKRRLRDLALLVMRTLFIVFLVGLFSRPVVRQGGLLGGEAGRIVLLLDVSASMGATTAGRSRLDAAREELQRLLGALPADAEVGFVSFSDRVESEQAPTRDRARLIGVLSAARVRARPSDVLPALKAAAGMGNVSEASTVLIVSDHAANVWRAAAASRGAWEGHDPRTRYVVADVGEIPQSRGVVEAALNLSEEGNLRGRAVFSGNRGAPSAPWTLELNGRTVGKGDVTPADGRGAEADLQAQLPEGGYYAGRIHIVPDAMAFDDEFYLAGRVPKGFRVLLVDGERGAVPSDSELYYVRSALESPRDPRIESIDTATPDSLASVRFADYDAIVIGNAVDLSGRESDLRTWVENGGGVLLSAGSKWPRAPERVLGLVNCSGRARAALSAAIPEARRGLLSEVAGIAGFEWNQVKIEERVILPPESVEQTLLALSDGSPLLAQRRIGKGHVVVLTTTLDRAWTNLPSKPAFAPLMRELVASLADPLREQTSLQGFVDEPMRVTLPDGVRSVTIIAPDGTASSAGIDRDGRLEWTPPPAAGLYEARTDRPDRWFKLAVNMRDIPSESDTRRVRDADIRTALPDANVQRVSFRSGSSRLTAAVEGKDVATALLIVLFLILAAETIISRRTSRRAA